jgi:hypothetical protein
VVKGLPYLIEKDERRTVLIVTGIIRGSQENRRT